jgi:hypothetical protein
MPRMRKMGCGEIKEPVVAFRRSRKTLRAQGGKSALVRSRLDPRSVPVVVSAKVLSGFRLFLSFQDGAAGEVALAPRLSGTVFEPLKNERYFGQVRVDPELGTVVWPNGADFAPEFLYEQIRKHAP